MDEVTLKYAHFSKEITIVLKNKKTHTFECGWLANVEYIEWTVVY